MYKLSVFVPESHLESLKVALFEAGAGKIGHYDSCCWQTLGEGQFRPLKHSRPFTGTTDQLSTIAEYKLEMVVTDDLIKPAITALKQAHPYEEPAYECWKLTDI
ncbi:MAG TPA: NGG1p interacting factor NIF3 [Gammaproteobacteria bacterium]|nr:NGG1p interacting factor NIF3 [Gammaproteobacteria bacterium]